MNILKQAQRLAVKWFCESGSYEQFSSSIATLNDSVGVITYREYVPNSPQWKDRLTIYRQYYGDECQIHRHKVNGGLCLHHRNYNSVGHEALDDVVLLCRRCHFYIHKEHIINKQIASITDEYSIKKQIMDRIENL
jgi:hypothetical protein